MQYQRERSGMMKVYGKFAIILFVFFMSFIMIYPKTIYAADDKKAEEIRKKIEALEAKKKKFKSDSEQKYNEKKPEGKSGCSGCPNTRR